MSDLYTVSYDRKLFITKFDAAGKATRTETTIRETHHDLPAATAQHYKDTMPDANVVVTRQEREVGRGSRVSFGDTGSRRTSIDASKFEGKATKKVDRPVEVNKPKSSSKAELDAMTKPPKSKPAFGGGDYGTLVTKLARDH